jgi:hypothetical protein
MVGPSHSKQSAPCARHGDAGLLRLSTSYHARRSRPDEIDNRRDQQIE